MRMVIATTYQNYFAVLNGGKAVPYGGISRPDGGQNYGFRILKGKPDEITKIPEAQKDDDLFRMLNKINAVETGLFSIGCESSDVIESETYRVSGYIEFALNDRRLVADAVPYFEIFFHFTQRLNGLNFTERVIFNWGILGATFLDVRCDGMTCTVGVDTDFHSSKEAAKSCWSSALGVLGDHLAEIKDRGFARLF